MPKKPSPRANALTHTVRVRITTKLNNLIAAYEAETQLTRSEIIRLILTNGLCMLGHLDIDVPPEGRP